VLSSGLTFSFSRAKSPVISWLQDPTVEKPFVIKNGPEKSFFQLLPTG